MKQIVTAETQNGWLAGIGDAKPDVEVNISTLGIRAQQLYAQLVPNIQSLLPMRAYLVNGCSHMLKISPESWCMNWCMKATVLHTFTRTAVP